MKQREEDSVNYVEGQTFAKLAAIAWWICILLLTPIALYELPRIFNPLTQQQSLHVLWWLVVATFFGLSWIASIYFLYLGIGAIRDGEFPAHSAILPFRARQNKGRFAYITAVLVILIATFILAMSIVLTYKTYAELRETAEQRKRLIELGVIHQ